MRKIATISLVLSLVAAVLVPLAFATECNPPELLLSGGDYLDFGVVYEGDKEPTERLTINNTGDANLTVKLSVIRSSDDDSCSDQGPEPFILLSGADLVVPPGKSSTVRIRMIEPNCNAPYYALYASATLKLETNDPLRPSKALPLRGEYRARGSALSRLGNQPNEECRDVDSFGALSGVVTVDALNPKQAQRKAVKVMFYEENPQTGELVLKKTKVGTLPITSKDLIYPPNVVRVVELTRGYGEGGTRIRPFRGMYRVTQEMPGREAIDPPKPWEDVE